MSTHCCAEHASPRVTDQDQHGRKVSRSPFGVLLTSRPSNVQRPRGCRLYPLFSVFDLGPVQVLRMRPRSVLHHSCPCIMYIFSP